MSNEGPLLVVGASIGDLFEGAGMFASMSAQDFKKFSYRCYALGCTWYVGSTWHVASIHFPVICCFPSRSSKHRGRTKKALQAADAEAAPASCHTPLVGMGHGGHMASHLVTPQSSVPCMVLTVHVLPPVHPEPTLGAEGKQDTSWDERCDQCILIM